MKNVCFLGREERRREEEGGGGRGGREKWLAERGGVSESQRLTMLLSLFSK